MPPFVDDPDRGEFLHRQSQSQGPDSSGPQFQKVGNMGIQVIQFGWVSIITEKQIMVVQTNQALSSYHL